MDAATPTPPPTPPLPPLPPLISRASPLLLLPPLLMSRAALRPIGSGKPVAVAVVPPPPPVGAAEDVRPNPPPPLEGDAVGVPGAPGRVRPGLGTDMVAAGGSDRSTTSSSRGSERQHECKWQQ